jgi:transposase
MDVVASGLKCEACAGSPTLKAHYQALVGRGRPKKVALIACVRRLLGILNAIVRTRTPWRAA